MARSSTSPKDLHEGLVARLRAGERIPTGKIPSHRLATAAARLRREGLEVAREKQITNPGKFPAMTRSVYYIEDPPPTTNGSSPVPPEPKLSKNELIRRRLLAGEELSPADVARELDISISALGVVAEGLRKKGYLVTVRREGTRSYYRCSAQPIATVKSKPKVPKWVAEAEEDEAAEFDGPVEVPRLFSIISKTEVVDGQVLVTIRDGDEFFEAILKAQQD